MLAEPSKYRLLYLMEQIQLSINIILQLVAMVITKVEITTKAVVTMVVITAIRAAEILAQLAGAAVVM